MRTAIFDLDGTLADTSRDLLAAANACFEAEGHGAPLTHADHAAVAFAGGRAMLRAGAEGLGLDWDEAAISLRYPHLLSHYGAHIDVHTVLYPGVEAALDRLAAAGWVLSICTNKPEGLAEILTARLGIRDRFGALVGADTLATRKPDAAPVIAAAERAGGDAKRAVLIGDTVTDREASRSAGIPSVLVTFGPDGHGVAALQPDALLHGYEDLPDLLETLL